MTVHVFRRVRIPAERLLNSFVRPNERKNSRAVKQIFIKFCTAESFQFWLKSATIFYLLFLSRRFNSSDDVASTDTPKAFLKSQHVGRCCTNVIRKHRCVEDHYCKNVIPDYCCVLCHSLTVISGHCCATVSSNNYLSSFLH
jgi:hypothetical protein